MDVQLPGGPVFSEKCLPSLPAVERRSTCFLCLDIVLLCFACCLLVCVSFCLMFFFSSCKTHNMKLRYLRRQLQKALKIDTNGGVVIRGIHATKCHYVGIPKRFGPMRSSFFCVSIFCQLLLRGPGFSLQNCHFSFPSDLLSSDYFVLIRWTKPTQLTYIPSPHAQKKIMLSYNVHQGHPQTWINHESWVLSISIFPTHQKTSNHSGVFQPHKMVQGIWCQRLWVWVC